MPLRLDDFAQSGVHALDGIGDVDHPPDVRWKCKKRNHLIPVAPPCCCNRRELHTPWPRLKRVQLRQGCLGTGSGVDRLDGRCQRLAVLPAGIVQTVANQVDNEGLQRGGGEDCAKSL